MEQQSSEMELKIVEEDFPAEKKTEEKNKVEDGKINNEPAKKHKPDDLEVSYKFAVVLSKINKFSFRIWF